MEKTKEEFVYYIKQATENIESDAYVELYTFLLGCFTRADKNFEGRVTRDNFDQMIEEAGELPRRYGFAPQATDLYKTDEIRKEKRTEMFNQMNPTNEKITFGDFLEFSIKHITGKVATLEKSVLFGAGTKEQFCTFIKEAMKPDTEQHKELYYFLLKCFLDADRDHDGALLPNEFDNMIEIAAAAPRNFGLAPKSSEMFKNEAERLQKRLEHFVKMDTKNDGKIHFDAWLKFAKEHILAKAATI